MTEAATSVVEQELNKERDDLVTQVTAMEVVDTPTYESAGEFLKAIKDLRGKIAESCDPVISAAHKAHKAAVKQKKEHESPLIKAEGLLKERIGAYDVKIERERREEEARLAAEAAKQDEEARLAEAEALEAAGEHEAADRVLSEPAALPPPVAVTQKPKVEGVSSRTLYAAELYDIDALIDAAARAPKGQGARLLLMFNQPAANQTARATKGAMRFPGVRVKHKPSVAVRT